MGIKLTIFSAFVVFASLIVADLSLSDIQPINGFSNACAKSYGTVATGCDLSSFFPPTRDLVMTKKAGANNCTAACRSSLLMIQGYVSESCFLDNVKFSNESVLAHFALRTGVNWLCGTQSGIALKDIPLQVLKASAFAQSSAGIPLEPTATLSGALPPVKTSSDATFASATTSPVTSAVSFPPLPSNLSVSGNPPQTLSLSTFIYMTTESRTLSNSTILIWNLLPTATIATPGGPVPPITDAPTLTFSVNGSASLPASTVNSVNLTSSSLASAAPSVVLPPAPLSSESSNSPVISASDMSSGGLGSSATTTHVMESVTTNIASETIITTSATNKNAADVGKSSFALVLGMAAMVGFVA